MLQKNEEIRPALSYAYQGNRLRRGITTVKSTRLWSNLLIVCVIAVSGAAVGALATPAAASPVSTLPWAIFSTDFNTATVCGTNSSSWAIGATDAGSISSNVYANFGAACGSATSYAYLYQVNVTKGQIYAAEAPSFGLINEPSAANKFYYLTGSPAGGTVASSDGTFSGGVLNYNFSPTLTAKSYSFGIVSTAPWTLGTGSVIDGGSVPDSVLVPTPEPGSIMLFLSGVLGLVGFGRGSVRRKWDRGIQLSTK
jgi:hypothetical protein